MRLPRRRNSRDTATTCDPGPVKVIYVNGPTPPDTSGYDRQSNPVTRLNDEAIDAFEHGVVCTERGQHEEALAAFSRTVDIDRQLFAARRELFCYGLASALQSQGDCLVLLARPEAGLAALAEAAELSRRLPEYFPGHPRLLLATCLVSQYRALFELGRGTEALPLAREAADLCEALEREHPTDPAVRSTLAGLRAAAKTARFA